MGVLSRLSPYSSLVTGVLVFDEENPLQEMSFFDKAENTSGSLVARLGVDTASIRGAVGDQVGILVQNLATFVAAYAIAFSAGWKMTLVITAVLPLLIFATYMESKFMQGFANEVSIPLDAATMAMGKSASNFL